VTVGVVLAGAAVVVPDGAELGPLEVGAIVVVVAAAGELIKGRTPVGAGAREPNGGRMAAGPLGAGVETRGDPKEGLVFTSGGPPGLGGVEAGAPSLGGVAEGAAPLGEVEAGVGVGVEGAAALGVPNPGLDVPVVVGVAGVGPRGENPGLMEEPQGAEVETGVLGDVVGVGP